MAKTKYFYNSHTLRYEKLELSWFQRLLRIFGFLSAATVFAFIIIVTAYSYLDSPKEKQLKREIRALSLQYDLLRRESDQMNEVLVSLQDRDDNIYRVIFEAEPIPRAVREAGYGGASLYKQFEGYTNAGLMGETTKKIEEVKRKIYIQSKSFDEIQKMVLNKKEMLAHLPAIQPVANKDLKRFASGFGYRIHPIYKTVKFHEGIDFTAPRGTSIYATGSGTVAEANYGNRGFGNHVVIDHGYGYKTIYAHMSRIKVRQGQKVQRGDVLGQVGSTGLSTHPHLHYEVVKSGRKVNPINFFYNDLTPDEFQKMLDLASRHNQSFD